MFRILLDPHSMALWLRIRIRETEQNDKSPKIISNHKRALVIEL